jgi:hypothetical protein
MACGQPVADAMVLALVETCQDWHPIDIALAMSGAACSRQDPAVLPALALGDRDTILLDLRDRLFGPALALGAACPHCAARVELSQSVEALWVAEPDAAEREAAAAIEIAGVAMRLRPIDSRDLAAAAQASDADAARRLLAGRCLSPAEPGQPGCDPGQLDAATLDEIAARLARLDPQADLAFALSCPDCGHDWEAPFDIAAVLWREMQWKAEALIGDIHEIAAHYHWSESEILALNPARRNAYLRRIRS